MVGNITVHIRHGDTVAEFSGDYETVWRSVNRYFSEVLGPVNLLQRLTGAQDVTSLAEKIAGRVLVEGGSVSVLEEAETKRKIALCLAGAFVGHRLGLLESDAMTPKQVASATRLSEKNAANRLGEMWKAGLVRRVDEGRYVFTAALMKLIEEE